MTDAPLLQALVMSPSQLLSQIVGNHLTPTDLVVTPNLIALGLVPSW